ncbi:ead/Ea22-like family protein [Salmonella enterica]|nr:ead/Ea22-like family protein [Salmonella enterica]EDW8109584.1 ead/Ea22-like family protein [Salmonella enterica subsp. enterica serovar 4,[5],12:i:-]EGL5264454.1 ead/Ea22-like family protein [Salmonella enterica]VEA46775.1 Eae protein [Salmonella enterica subsp. arizonae]
MNIDKQALRISELEELNELLREKVKKLESDLWDKEQLRQVYSEKSFDLECKVRELEARNQKDFVWRGKEISRLNDDVDELKEKLGAAEMQIVNLKQNCENDPRIHEIVDLKESVAELASENALARNAVQAFCDVIGDNTEVISEEVGRDGVLVILEAMKATGNMPATDAFLAEVRAHGVEMFSEKFGGGTQLSDMVKEVAADFAAKLRKGVQS